MLRQPQTDSMPLGTPIKDVSEEPIYWDDEMVTQLIKQAQWTDDIERHLTQQIEEVQELKERSILDLGRGMI